MTNAQKGSPMSRSLCYRPVSGSVSAIAMVTLLGACSQPASHATVDLSGSNAGNFQTAQTFSPVTGQPVYNPSAGFGPQSFPDGSQYQPNSQFAAGNVPGNQVASLGFDGGGFDTFGILDQQQQSLPRTPIAQSSPSFGQQQQLLSSPQFQREAQSVNQAFEDSARLAAPPPFAEAESLSDLAPFERGGGDNGLEVAPVETGSAVRNSGRGAEEIRTRRSAIEETALEPIARPRNRDVQSIGNDYATIPDARSRVENDGEDAAEQVSRRYSPWLAPQFGSQERTESQERTPQRPPIRRTRERAEAPAERTGPDSDFARAARDLLPERPRDARLPAPSAVPPAPRSFSAGLTVPKASAEYPRPFELLRPGVWPELENPGVGLVQAPAPTQPRQFAAFAPPIVEPIGEDVQSASERRAKSYTIKGGDNLLTIANSLGTTPQALAQANSLDLEADIFIGQVLKVPGAPVEKRVFKQTPAVQISDAPDPSFIGGPKVKTINVDVANKARGLKQIQRASVPSYRVTTLGDPTPPRVETASSSKRFDWPVHGKVFRLNTGQVEIEVGNNAPVAASAAGKVVHVERGPMGVLVVIEHDNGWRSLTVGLDYSAVRPGEVVTQGKVIGKSSRDHRVRFELRDAATGTTDALAQLRG